MQSYNRGKVGVSHSEHVRQRVTDKIRAGGSESNTRPLGRLAQCILKEGTLKEGKGDERKARD